MCILHKALKSNMVIFKASKTTTWTHQLQIRCLCSLCSSFQAKQIHKKLRTLTILQDFLFYCVVFSQENWLICLFDKILLFSKNKKLCPFPAIIATITDWQGNFEALQLKDSLAYWTLNGGILKTISQSFTWKRSFWFVGHNHGELSFRNRMHTFSRDRGST